MRAKFFKPILKCHDGITHINSAPAALAVRGSERKGIAAADWIAETVFTNEKTSPRIEIPRSIVRTMRFVDSEYLRSTDLAVYWLLFGNARFQAIEKDTHSITLGAIARYLGIKSIARVVTCLEHLNRATVRYDFNLGGTRRQQTRLINISEFDADTARKGTDVVHYELPTIVREAVLVSKDYAWVDINALPRLTSKYAVMLYIRLSYIACQNFEARPAWDVSYKSLAGQLSYPTTCFRKLHVVTVVSEALAQINALGKLHKRFGFDCLVPDEFSDNFLITVGSSARRLREVAPADLPAAEYKKVVDRKALPLKDNQYPRITSLRQASTLLGKPTKLISDLWRTDVWGATNYNKGLIGLDAPSFLESIEKHGVESVFERWIDKRGFVEFGIVKAPDVAPPPPKTFMKTEPAVIVRIVESEYESDDDVTMAADYAYITPEAYEPERAPEIFEDVDDCEIAF
ncbi:hypothetical protein [Hoeflea alexandrii]|uniref:hypothetical protein n=1 Tax=Hoeflea alexandrii TaxID=288436 RepID=UPI0022AF7EE4|nr:hypothetical protein [Hoeflea alexandrii]MCZ4287266.1 hypothetical protein [Hoeflea alexandrii]